MNTDGVIQLHLPVPTILRIRRPWRLDAQLSVQGFGLNSPEFHCISPEEVLGRPVGGTRGRTWRVGAGAGVRLVGRGHPENLGPEKRFAPGQFFPNTLWGGTAT